MTGATFTASRAARARTRPSRPPASAPTSRWSAASATTSFADEALAGLEEAGVELDRLERDRGSTGVALIRSTTRARTQIVVAPGANLELRPRTSCCPTATRCSASSRSRSRRSRRPRTPARFFASTRHRRATASTSTADLLVVNRYELEALARTATASIAVTLGAEGAVLLEDGEEVARAAPPPVAAVDGTAAGDAFTACLVVSLLEGRARDEALRRACAAGALAASRSGAQPSLPTAAEVDATPGERRRSSSTATRATTTRSRSCSRSPRPRSSCVGITTVAGNQTLDKTTRNALQGARARRPRATSPSPPALTAPLRRERFVAANVHGESGIDGPDAARAEDAGRRRARGGLPRRADRARRRTLVPTGPLTNVALLLAAPPGRARPVERIVLMGGAIGEGNVTPGRRVQHLGRPGGRRAVFASGIEVTMIGLDVTHRALFDPAARERLAAPGRAGRSSPSCSDFYRRFHERAYACDGSPIHDAVAVAHVIEPELVKTATHVVSRRSTAARSSRGRTNVDLRGRVGWDAERDTSASDVDADAFVELLVERLGPRSADQPGQEWAYRPREVAPAWRARSAAGSCARRRPPASRSARPKARGGSAHHHPELIGLGLVALGLFLGTRPLRRLERRLRRRRSATARATWSAQPPTRCRSARRVGGLMVARSDLVDLRPVPHRARGRRARAAVVLGGAHGGYLGRGLGGVFGARSADRA